MTYNKKSVEDICVSGKKVLVRCDFNVPLKDGVITDENRITGALPTINYLREHGAKVILCSHLGRPKGEFNMKYSLAPVAKRLSEKLGFEVKLAEDVIGASAKKLAAELEKARPILTKMGDDPKDVAIQNMALSLVQRMDDVVAELPTKVQEK